MHRILPLLAGLVTLLAACGATEGGDAIVIALAGPIEQSYGRAPMQAAQMAVDEINRGGGIDGRRVELLVRDDEENAERAIEVAEELANDPRVIAVVGHVNSFATIASSQVYNEEARALLQISPTSTSPQVTEAGPWTFRVCPSDLEHGPALAAWAREQLGAERAAALYANDAYGRGLIGGFASEFERAGGDVVARDPFLPRTFEAGPDAIDPYLERAIGDGMDVLMIAGMLGEGTKILRAARRLGYRGTVLGSDGLIGVEAEGLLAEGVYISTAFLADRPTPEAQAFVRAYEQRFGETADMNSALAYDAVHLIAEAIRNVGTDRRAVRDYVAGVGSEHPAFEGVTGTIAFDENGDVRDKDMAIGVIRRGELVSATM